MKLIPGAGGMDTCQGTVPGLYKEDHHWNSSITTLERSRVISLLLGYQELIAATQAHSPPPLTACHTPTQESTQLIEAGLNLALHRRVSAIRIGSTYLGICSEYISKNIRYKMSKVYQ